MAVFFESDTQAASTGNRRDNRDPNRDISRDALRLFPSRLGMTIADTVDTVDTTAEECAELETSQSGGHQTGGNVDAHHERRRGMRVRQSRTVKIFEPIAGRYVGGRTIDLSSQGLRVELPARAGLRQGEIVKVHVGTASGTGAVASRRPMVTARVVWLTAKKNTLRPTLVAGLEFECDIDSKIQVA